MIDQKVVIMKLREFAINYSLEVKEDYLVFIFAKLKEKNIGNKDFIKAIDSFVENEETTFNKMPNLAQILKYADKKVSLAGATEVISWLERNVFISDNYAFNPPKKYIDWVYIRTNYKFENDYINHVIDKNFGSLRAMIERFGEQKIAGYANVFKRELEEMFSLIGDYEPNLTIEDGSEKVKIDGVVKNLGSMLKEKI